LPFLKNLDDLIPGFLFSAQTSIPESSENAITFNFFERALAFLYAFSRKVLPFSFTENPFGAAFKPTPLIFSEESILFTSFSLSLFEDAK